MRTFEDFKAIRDVISGRIPADILITNAKIVNVFTREILEKPLVIKNGYICGFFECEAKEVYDAKSQYIVPSFIDCHMHVESTMVTPDKLNDILLIRGVSTIMADPHEIANVMGTEGIQFMIDASKDLDLDVMIHLPSCVPCTNMEHSGAILKAKDLRAFYNTDNVHTLAEVMDYFAVRDDDDMLEKLYDAYQNGVVSDGHGSILDETGCDLYAALNIRNDHECVNADEVIDRIRRGIYTFIREGSITKNLKALLPAINESTYRFACFCTDDCHTDDLLEKHCIANVVRMAIQEGLDPIMAITMATLNAAQCYDLKEQGAVAPGYQASFFLCENLEDLQASRVYQHGKLVAVDGMICDPKAKNIQEFMNIPNTIHFKDFTRDDLRLKLSGNLVHIMKVVGGNVLTYDTVDTVNVEDGYFVGNAEKDQALLCVVERHHETGNIGKCIVTGFRMMKGAIATSVAHDSHNIICVGMNEKDMEIAITHLKEIHGGYVIVCDGKVISDVALDIGGLISSASAEKVCSQLHQIHSDVQCICKDLDYNPFLMLSFISLPVIPDIKLTDIGLIDVRSGKVMKVEVE